MTETGAFAQPLPPTVDAQFMEYMLNESGGDGKI